MEEMRLQIPFCIFTICGRFNTVPLFQCPSLLEPEQLLLLFSRNCSEQAAVLQVVLDDHIRHCIEDELNVRCVSGTCEVGVDLLKVPLGVSAPMPVQGLKFQLYVGRSILVRVGT